MTTQTLPSPSAVTSSSCARRGRSRPARARARSHAHRDPRPRPRQLGEDRIRPQGPSRVTIRWPAYRPSSGATSVELYMRRSSAVTGPPRSSMRARSARQCRARSVHERARASSARSANARIAGWTSRPFSPEQLALRAEHRRALAHRHDRLEHRQAERVRQRPSARRRGRSRSPARTGAPGGAGRAGPRARPARPGRPGRRPGRSRRRNGSARCRTAPRAGRAPASRAARRARTATKKSSMCVLSLAASHQSAWPPPAAGHHDLGRAGGERGADGRVRRGPAVLERRESGRRGGRVPAPRCRARWTETGIPSGFARRVARGAAGRRLLP